MAKQIYVNIPVSDLPASIAFYEKLGFTNNPMFTNDKGAGMQWSEDIIVMLLTREFFKTFLKDKEVADTQKTAQVGLCLSFDSKEEVQKFADTAKANGGDFYRVDMGIPEDAMFGYEVTDPDGNLWEPLWMNPNFNPQDNPVQEPTPTA